MFVAARRAGWLTVDHVADGTVLGPDGTLQTRAGSTVRLMDLLDDAVTAARTVVTEKNPGLPAAELDAIAEQAGIGAVKYADLSTSRIKDYTFDPARMTAFNGNTGVYLGLFAEPLRVPRGQVRKLEKVGFSMGGSPSSRLRSRVWMVHTRLCRRCAARSPPVSVSVSATRHVRS